MRGPDEQTNHLFSYLSPEQRVRADHPLRAIRAMTDRVFAGPVAPIFGDVFGDWPAFDSARAIAARARAPVAVYGAQRAAADGGDRLQRPVSLVCGVEHG